MPGRFRVPFAVALLHGALQAQAVSFLAHRDFPIARGCCTVVSGDFNGDGKLDLVVAYGGNLALLPGDGTGGFKPKIDFGTFSGSLQKLAASDVNSDGKLDLVVNSGLQANIFMGNGNGTERSPRFRGWIN